jgi:hypothetical protein
MHKVKNNKVTANLTIETVNKYQCWFTNLAEALIMLIAILILFLKQHMTMKIIKAIKALIPTTIL